MGKIIVNIIKFLGYSIFSLILVVYYSVKYVFTGASIWGRIAVLGIYSGIVASIIVNPMVFKVIVAIILLIDVLFSISMVKDYGKNTNEDGNESKSDYKKDFQEYKSNKNPFFEGMSIEEAKKEKRKLMKIYHPDNFGGNLAMAQKITEAFTNYCTAHRK